MVGIVLGLSLFLGSFEASAVSGCEGFFKQSRPVSSPTFQRNELYKKLEFKSDELAILNRALAAYGIRETKSVSVVDAVKALTLALSKNKTLDFQDKADVIGEIALSLNAKIKANRGGQTTETASGLTGAREALSIMSVFGEAVSYFESFKKSDFVKDDNLAMVREGKAVRFLRLNELRDWVMSYVDGKGIYYKEIPKRGKGILMAADIRDVASHNSWVVELRGHDIRHAHFLFGHPWAANAYFRAARSRVEERFALMGGLFEGVDTLQFGWENQLTTYFGRNLRMNLEEGLVFLSFAPARALNEIMSKVDNRGLMRFMNGMKNWTPKKSGPFQPEGFSGRGLDEDLRIMMESSYATLLDPQMNRYTNYNRSVWPMRAGLRKGDNPTINRALSFPVFDGIFRLFSRDRGPQPQGQVEP